MLRVVLALALLCTTALAQAAEVVVLAPSDATPETHEAVTRTQGELVAAGFEVRMAVLDPGADPRAAVEQAAADEEATAVIAIFPTRDGTTADVWVTDRVTDKTTVRRVHVGQLPPEERPRALSIRAVELLRASLVEAVAPETQEQPRRRLPTTVVSWFARPKAPLEGLGAAVGVGLLASFDGISPAGAPYARLSYGTRYGLTGRLWWFGPAFGARAEGDAGSASIRQELALIDLAYVPRVDWAGFTPLLSAGIGAFHLDAVGEVRAPLLGRRAEIWAFAISAGAGLGYRLTPEVMAVIDAAALVTVPRAVITVEGKPLGTTGRPALTSSLGVAVRFD